MKSFLLILLAITVHHTIQYEKIEELKLINTKKPSAKHEEQSINNLRKRDIQKFTNMKDSVKDLDPYSEHYHNYYRELRDGEDVHAPRRWLDRDKVINWVNQLFGKALKAKASRPRPRGDQKGMTSTRKLKVSRNTRKPKHKKTRQDSNDSVDIDDNIPESFEITFNNKDNDEEQILQHHKTEYKKVDAPLIFILPAGE